MMEKTALKVHKYGKDIPKELLPDFEMDLSIHYFDATVNLDKATQDLLNQKIKKIKDQY